MVLRTGGQSLKGWDEVIEIKRRIKEGRKVSEVARELGIDRKTVRKYRDLTVEEIAVYRRQSKRRSRKVDHYKDWVGHRVKVMAEDGVINAQAIYEELKNLGYEGYLPAACGVISAGYEERRSRGGSLNRSKHLPATRPW